MMRIIGLTLAIALVAPAASAEQYWIAYEGNDFPENEGWLRFIDGEGAQRAIEDGWLMLDSRASLSIYDYYRWNMGGTLDPGPGETFVLQWKLRIDELSGWRDPTIGVRSDEKWAAGFEFTADTIWSVFESDVSATFEPGIPHTFELRSADMLGYDLYIDGALAIEGSFWLSLAGSRVAWGDGIQGGASLTYWDYVRFGVIPEPATGLLLSGALALASRRLGRIRPAEQRV